MNRDTEPMLLSERRRLEQDAVSAARQRDALVAVLARVFGWQDTTWVHALLHVEAAVANLRADAAAAQEAQRGAEAELRDEVRRALEQQREACADHLDRCGYNRSVVQECLESPLVQP